MECLETTRLLKWLNGSLAESETTTIGDHISSCDACQKRLEDLTDDPSINPPNDPTSLLRQPTFTDEPHFHSMRQKLGQKVSGLADNACISKPDDSKNDGVRNQTNTDAVNLHVETIEQNAESTLTTKEPSETSTQLEETIFINGYHIEGLIGRGGFAQVFQAWDKQLERNVAIKVLDTARLNTRNRHRFLREAKTASSFESPHVVRVLTSGEVTGRPYIVMELIEGQTLAAWVEHEFSERRWENDALQFAGRNTTSTTIGVELLVQICNGVQAVHDAGLVHRDIKPSNIFIDEKKSIAKLGDFGLARVLEQDTVTLTRAAELAGTPAYMSPEQAVTNNDVGPSSDIYSLGATLYQVLTGQPPFRGSSMAILKQVSDSSPLPPSQLNPDVPRDLETICLKALEKSPGQRYASSRDLGNDLQRALDGQPIAARPISNIQKLFRWAKANAMLAATLGLLFLSMLGGTIFSTAMWLRADLAEARAITDRTAALNSLTTLVDSLYVDLTDNAASVEAREAVVEAAIEGLRSITQLKDDTVADRTTMLAYRQLGYLKRLKGENEEAEKHYLTSLKSARAFDDQKGSNQTGFELARAISDLAIHYQGLNQERDLTAKHFAESSGILYEILVKDPDNAPALLQLVENHLYKMDSFKENMAQAELLKAAPTVLKDLEQLMSLPDPDPESYDIAQRVQYQVGRAYFDVNNLNKASKFFALAQSNLDKALEWSPNRTNLIASASVLNRAHALVASSLGQQAQANELFSKALIAFQRLAASDPDDQTNKQQVANTYSLMSNPLHAMGEHAKAVKSLERAIEGFEDILRDSPDNYMLKRVLAEACFKKSYNEMYLFNWDKALSGYEQTIEYLKDDEGKPLTDPASQNQTGLSNLSINAIGLLSEKKWAVRNDGSECLALVHLARRDASTSTTDDLSEETLTEIRRINPEIEATTFDELFQYVKTLNDMQRELFVYRLQYEARALALRARNVAKTASPDDTAPPVAKAITILNMIKLMVPQAKTELILNEPDLIWLRETDQFAESRIGEPAKRSSAASQ